MSRVFETRLRLFYIISSVAAGARATQRTEAAAMVLKYGQDLDS